MLAHISNADVNGPLFHAILGAYFVCPIVLHIILIASQMVSNSISIIKVYGIRVCPAIYPMQSILPHYLFILHIHKDIDSNMSKHKPHPNPYKTILKQHVLRLQKKQMDQIQYPQSYQPIPVLCGDSPIF